MFLKVFAPSCESRLELLQYVKWLLATRIVKYFIFVKSKSFALSNSVSSFFYALLKTKCIENGNVVVLFAVCSFLQVVEAVKSFENCLRSIDFIPDAVEQGKSPTAWMCTMV